jgi:prepilin-type N-terminal cleavage/methylation domain-containing protein
MMRRTISSTRDAFTLLEILLAIAVAGLLLGACSYFMVSLATIWTLRTDEDSFEEHADGVAVFLQKAFDEASSRHQPTWKEQTDSDSKKADSDSKTTTTDTDSGKSAGLWTNAGVTMARIESDPQSDPPLIHFTFFQFPPALGATIPATTLGVESWLKFDEKLGLAIVWKDIWSIQETTLTSDKDLMRTSVISSFVTKIVYIYYDTDMKRWDEYETPHEYSGAYALPAFIRLVFTQNGHDTTRMIHIQATARKMPVF